MMKAGELIWAFLPEGLEPYFEVEDVLKTPELFRVTLVEKSDLIGVPAPWQGKRIVSSSLDSVTLNDYPFRGRKGGLLLKRRSWKFEGIAKWYKREIEVYPAPRILSRDWKNISENQAQGSLRGRRDFLGGGG